MTLKEAYQFLDTTETAKKDVVTARYKEKLDFFKMLHSNAPNVIIRNLQEKNLQTLAEIKQLLPALAEHTDPAVGNFGAAPPKNGQAEKTEFNKAAAPKGALGIAAFLVVHTEGKQTESFPLFEGDNPIGRNAVADKKCILITDDDYVSRFHCVILLRNSPTGMSAAIADDGRYNNNKPSLNGTYFNGSAGRIKTQKLNNGDTVQIGMTKMVFKWNEASKKDIEREVASTGFVKTVVVNI